MFKRIFLILTIIIFAYFSFLFLKKPSIEREVLYLHLRTTGETYLEKTKDWIGDLIEERKEVIEEEVEIEKERIQEEVKERGKTLWERTVDSFFTRDNLEEKE